LKTNIKKKYKILFKCSKEMEISNTQFIQKYKNIESITNSYKKNYIVSSHNSNIAVIWSETFWTV
jgi:hypothetical protein